jgi:zinc/manganese transport system substrate-binding protein
MIMRTTLILKRSALVVIAFLGAAACGGGVDESTSIELVATTSILGDITSNLLDGTAGLTTIMPPGVDPHDFEPSARQVAALRSADLIIANGLGLEESLEDVLQAAVEDGAVLLEIGPEVEPMPLEGSEAYDPHIWLDPVRMIKAVDLITSALTDLDSSVEWATGASAYRTELQNLDGWIEQQFGSVEASSRMLFTGHQAFGYFAARYDLDVVATILPGATTTVEPSASSFADVIEVLAASSAQAIFTDISESQAFAEQLADQVDRTVDVVPLFVGALGPEGSGAETYLGLMRWNVEAIRTVFER